MLCVTIRIVTFFLQLGDQLLDARGGDRVERGGRLVEQQDLRIGRQRARDAQPLLLSAGQVERDLLQAVLDFVPERGAAQRLLDLVGRASRLALTPRTRRP